MLTFFNAYLYFRLTKELSITISKISQADHLNAEHQPVTQINWGGQKTTVEGVNISECLPITQINWGSDNKHFQNITSWSF